VVEDIRILSLAKNVVFNDISFMVILTGDPPPPSDSVKVKRPPVASENLT